MIVFVVPLNYLIRTNSIDTDDRLQKTLSLLRGAGADPSVLAIVKTRVPNQPNVYQATLRSRDWLPSGGRMLAVKYTEMVLRGWHWLVGRAGPRWYANYEFLPLQALEGRRRTVIWDLHEMPPDAIARSALTRRFLARRLCSCHVIVCNEARRRALEDAFDVDLSDALVLRNLPDADTIEALRASRRASLAEQSTGDDLRLVIVGGSMPVRYGPQSIEVVADLRATVGRGLSLEVVGGTAHIGSEPFVTSTGIIPFKDLVHQSAQADVSLCFYRRNSQNNLLCEPNRFFQAIAAGQHVITFDHPSLRDIGYPWHHVIDEDHFASTLTHCLEAISRDPGDPHERLAWAERDPARITFETQSAAFEAWIAERVPGTGPQA